MKWITRAQLLQIHRGVTGLPFSAVDDHKLDSALSRPFTSAFGNVLFPTLWDKVACLMHSITTTHPFTEDGNKRAAWAAGKVILRINGWHLAATADDGEAFVLAVTVRDLDIPAAARWLERHSTPV